MRVKTQSNEIENLKEELRQVQLAYQMAVQMGQFKAGFLARTSHELRSPLSSLIGLHQLILSDLCESPEEQKEFIAEAYNSAMKLMELIDEIVAVSKTECGTNKLEMESIQLADVFTEIYNLTYLQAANRNLRLEIVPPDYAIHIRADRVRLIQLIINLLDSGVAMMREGRIKLLAVADTQAEEVKITIDFDCPIKLWQEDTELNEPAMGKDLEEVREFVQNINLSPKMRLLLSRTLLETMGGSLELSELSDRDRGRGKTQMLLTCKQAKL